MPMDNFMFIITLEYAKYVEYECKCSSKIILLIRISRGANIYSTYTYMHTGASL